MIKGTPIANYHVATMDRDGRLQPPGATGELVIMGDGVGRGYIGREELTKRSFITLLGRRAYVALGCYPLSEMSSTEELSYIEETARAVVLLSGTNSSFTVFHAFNSHTVEMGNIILGLNQMGLTVEPVKEAVFQKRLREGLAYDALNRYLSPLVDYDLDDEENLEVIPAENEFTINALYHLGFRWTITDMNIIDTMIETLRTLGFFDL